MGRKFTTSSPKLRVKWVKTLVARLTLNNAKSALISLLDGCDEFVAVDDIEVVSSSSIFRQMSSSFVALAVLVDGGNTGERKKEAKIVKFMIFIVENWIMAVRFYATRRQQLLITPLRFTFIMKTILTHEISESSFGSHSPCDSLSFDESIMTTLLDLIMTWSCDWDHWFCLFIEKCLRNQFMMLCKRCHDTNRRRFHFFRD